MDKRVLFPLLVSIVWVVIYLTKYLLVSDTLYYNSLIEQLSFEQISTIIEQGEKWQWVSYALVPVILIIKITFVSICLSIGVYVVHNNFNFKEIFGTVLQAEFIFIIPSFLKVIWFSFFEIHYTIADMQLFYPFSLLNIFDPLSIETWLVYPLQTLNIFELIYWFLLAQGLTRIINRNLTKSFEVVIAGYGTGLTLWVVIIMFLTVTSG